MLTDCDKDILIPELLWQEKVWPTEKGHLKDTSWFVTKFISINLIYSHECIERNVLESLSVREQFCLLGDMVRFKCIYLRFGYFVFGYKVWNRRTLKI